MNNCQNWQRLFLSSFFYGDLSSVDNGSYSARQKKVFILIVRRKGRRMTLNLLIGYLPMRPGL